ncbi:MAG: hypothetical protein U0990_12610 [Candidatus Nanopelagicales bacterium]|nr:hypothetical protein [Candidatus Nanopelagicales bacterium]
MMATPHRKLDRLMEAFTAEVAALRAEQGEHCLDFRVRFKDGMIVKVETEKKRVLDLSV